ncbi:MAG: hypothetical protein DLM72_12105 [Candidatus Nitrosopolaris wilkensis]|nr:MAG: hypothetical protein DLM72_12105 [Candidatus Nitrosopolaris wilkensis]
MSPNQENNTHGNKSATEPVVNLGRCFQDYREISDFFDLGWDILISKASTSAPETAKIRPADCNIGMYAMGVGGGNLRDIKPMIIANNTNDPITTMATAFFTISTFRAKVTLIQNWKNLYFMCPST